MEPAFLSIFANGIQLVPINAAVDMVNITANQPGAGPDITFDLSDTITIDTPGFYKLTFSLAVLTSGKFAARRNGINLPMTLFDSISTADGTIMQTFHTIFQVTAPGTTLEIVNIGPVNTTLQGNDTLDNVCAALTIERLS